MAGLSALDAMQKCAAHDGLHFRPCAPAPSVHSAPVLSTGTLLCISDNSSVWIAGVRYKPEAETATAAIADVNSATTTADLGKYQDWAPDSTAPKWNSGNDNLVGITDTLLAFAMTSLLTLGTDLPVYLDSGASAHIFCRELDFSELKPITPCQITGVGNALVSATGIGTVQISLPGSAAMLNLHDLLFAPSASVRLVSISQLDDSGYSFSLQGGRCTHSALLSLVSKPDLEMWHCQLGHANSQTVLNMACAGIVTGMPADISLVPQAVTLVFRENRPIDL